MEQYLTAAEFREMFKLSEDAYFAMRRRGDGPPALKLGRKVVRFPASAVEEWVRANTVGRTAINGG